MESQQSNYPDDWDGRRRRVYKRANYSCRNCGAEGGSSGSTELHAHHVVPISRGGTHELSNLKCLCNKCHSKVHGWAIGGAANSRMSTKLEDPTATKTPTENTNVGIYEVKEAYLNLAASSLKTVYHLSRAVVDVDNTDIEKEMRDFLELFSTTNAFALNARLTSQKFEEDAGGTRGLQKVLTQQRSKVEITSYQLLGPVYEKIWTELENSTADIESLLDASEEVNSLKTEAKNMLAAVNYDVLLLIASINRVNLAAAGETTGQVTKDSWIRGEVVQSPAAQRWHHCPNCGFEYAVLETEEEIRYCILCAAEWTKKSWIWKLRTAELTEEGWTWEKWQCTHSEFSTMGQNIENEVKSPDDWLSRGNEANENNAYQNLDTVETDEIARMVLHFFDVVSQSNT